MNKNWARRVIPLMDCVNQKKEIYQNFITNLLRTANSTPMMSYQISQITNLAKSPVRKVVQGKNIIKNNKKTENLSS